MKDLADLEAGFPAGLCEVSQYAVSDTFPTLDGEYPSRTFRSFISHDVTPRGLAERLLELVRTRPAEPLPDETPDARRLRLQGDHQRAAEIAALKRRLAFDFGAARGWRPAKRFGIVDLAKQGRGRGRHRVTADWPHAYLDHPYFFRGAEGRAVAAVGHPYGPATPQLEADAAAWAEANDLRVSFPTDWPSWWYPGWTVLVLFEPMGGRS